MPGKIHPTPAAAKPVLCQFRQSFGASELEKVRKKLGILSTSLGGFSEAASVFDAELLEQIAAELGQQLKPIGHDSRLDEAPGILTLVDGTVVSALAKLVEPGQHRSTQRPTPKHFRGFRSARDQLPPERRQEGRRIG
jgi:hypothetical protein